MTIIIDFFNHSETIFFHFQISKQIGYQYKMFSVIQLSCGTHSSIYHNKFKCLIDLRELLY